jgi:hypothetical protein
MPANRARVVAARTPPANMISDPTEIFLAENPSAEVWNPAMRGSSEGQHPLNPSRSDQGSSLRLTMVESLRAVNSC